MFTRSGSGTAKFITDAEADALTVALATGAAHGTLWLNEDGGHQLGF